MEAEDIKKIAEKTGYPEKDVALALRASKDDVAEAEKLLAPSVHIIKGCYSAKTNRLNGGIIVVVDTVQKKIGRTKSIASYDVTFADIALDQSWEQIEKSIVDAEIKQNFVPAISRDLTAEIGFALQETITDTITLVSNSRLDELGSRLRRIICACLGDSDVVVNCVVDQMSQLAMKIHDHEIKVDDAAEPVTDAPAADAATGSAGTASVFSPGRELILKTDVILSPVAGVPVTSLNPGDYILVRITDTNPQALYIANLLHAVDGAKTLPVRVPIRKIDRSESARLVITTEFGPGVFGRTVVQEGLKIKSADDGAAAKLAGVKLPVGQVLLIIFLGGLVLALLVVVVYYVSTLV